VTIPLFHKVYLDQVHHLYYRTLYPPLFSVFSLFRYYFIGLIVLSSCVCNRPCGSSLVSTLSFPPLPSHLCHPDYLPLYSCAIITIIILMVSVHYTCEQKHAIFGFLILAYLTQPHEPQFHPFPCK
jgi:hypothetical protein